MNKHATCQQLRGHLAYLKLAADVERAAKALEDIEGTARGALADLDDEPRDVPNAVM